MQIIPLKFKGIWILHLEILNFGFYSRKFYFICINNPFIHILH